MAKTVSRRYADLECRFWVDSIDWPANVKLLYLYLFSCIHVHGVTGIGKVPETVMRSETGLAPKALGKAKAFLDESGKVVFEGDWYWIVGRMKHTLLTNSGEAHGTMTPAARAYLVTSDAPVAMRRRAAQRYAYLIGTLSISDVHVTRRNVTIDETKPQDAVISSLSLKNTLLEISQKLYGSNGAALVQPRDMAWLTAVAYDVAAGRLERDFVMGAATECAVDDEAGRLTKGRMAAFTGIVQAKRRGA